MIFILTNNRSSVLLTIIMFTTIIYLIYIFDLPLYNRLITNTLSAINIFSVAPTLGNDNLI